MQKHTEKVQKVKDYIIAHYELILDELGKKHICDTELLINQIQDLETKLLSTTSDKLWL